MVRKIPTLIVLVLLLAPLCVEGLSRFTQHMDKLTWHDAQAYCRQYHSDLVSILTIGEKYDFRYGTGWIGLYDDSLQNVWKWIREGTKANYTNWRNGSPGSGKCAYKYASDSKWRTRSCTDTRKFMCSINETILVTEKKTWVDALQHCRSLEAVNTSRPATEYQNHRYDLVSLLSSTDQSDAQGIAQEATTDEVWTGLRFLAGGWMWLSGERVKQPALPQCPVARHCGILGKSGTKMYQRRNCQEERNFLCKERV